MARLGGIYLSVGAKTTQLKRDLDRAHGMTKKAAVLMKQEIGNISFAGAGITTTAFAAGIAMVSKKAIELGRDFESTMKTVQAWSGASGESLKKMTDLAREMGATTEHTANQAAGALKFLSAAGFDAEKSMAALPGTLDLATAGQVALAEATDITTDVLTAFGMRVEGLSRVNDAFIVTSSNSNTNVLMLGQSMKMVAPTAKLFGQEVEQTAAWLGALANAGVKAEMAGSGLNMILLKSQRAAKALGMEIDSSLIDVLKRMKEEQWGAVKIGEAFGARQVKTAAILMDNIDVYERLNDKIFESSGATGELAAIIRDSLDNDIKVLASTMEEELLRVYDLHNDYMRDTIQQITEWVRTNPQLIEQIGDIAEAMAETAKAMLWVIENGSKFADSWIKTFQAIGLASGGMITWNKALFDGVHAVNSFDTELGRLNLTAEKLREEIETLEKRAGKDLFSAAATRRVKARLEENRAQLKAVTKQISDITTQTKLMANAMDDPDLDFGHWTDGLDAAGKSAKKVLSEIEKGLANDKIDSALDKWFDFVDDFYKDAKKLDDFFMESRIENIWIAEEERAKAWQNEIEMMNRVIEKEKIAYEELKDGQVKAQEDALKEQEKAYQHMFNNIHDIHATLWDDFLDDGKLSMENLLATAKRVFAEFAATWSTKIMMNAAFGIQGAGGAGGVSGALSGFGQGGLGGLGGLFGSLGGLFGGTSATAGVAAANTAASLGIGNIGAIAGAGGAGIMSGIGAGLMAVAPYAAIAAVALPMIMDAFKDDPDPRVGLLTGFTEAQGAAYAGPGEETSSSFRYRPWLQDVDNRDATGDALRTYFDAKLIAVDDAFDIGVADIISTSMGQVIINPEDHGGDMQKMIKLLEDGLFNIMRVGMVEGIESGLNQMLGADFFKQIAVDGESAFDTFIRFGSVVKDTDDFMGKFTRQIQEFGESTKDAFNNVQGIEAISDMFNQMGMSDEELSIKNINDQFDAIDESLKAFNATSDLYIQSEKLRYEAIFKVTDAIEDSTDVLGDFADAINGVTNDIQRTITGIMGDGLTGVKSKEYFESRYSELLAAAQLDHENVAEFTGFANDYLDFISDYGDPSAMERVLNDLFTLKSGLPDPSTMTADDIDSVSGNLTLAQREQNYLNSYSDVMAAVLRGDFVSGLQHFQMYGADEGRTFKTGGVISGPTSGYTVPTTFHGVEHITTDSDMQDVRGLLQQLVNKQPGNGGDTQIKVFVGDRELTSITSEIIRTDPETQTQIRRVARV